MPFILKKVSDHGTTNPMVARLSVQTSELIKYYPITEKQREDIFGIYHQKVQPHLLQCYEIKEKLLTSLETIDAEFSHKDLQTQSYGRTATVPQVMELQEDCETYLYNAKSALRDLAGIFESLFGEKFTEARYDKIHKWAEKKFGETDDFTSLIKQDQDLWIRKIVSMRNAVEHPGGHSGYLYIHNIEIASDTKTRRLVLVPPTWNLNSEPRATILNDMNTCIRNILEFAEDILVLSLEKFDKKFPIVVSQIPEKERDPSCPVRLKMTLRYDLIKKTKT